MNTLQSELLPDPLPSNPVQLAATWAKEAWDKRVQPNPDAMTIATVDAQGHPSARIVLCKQIVADPGYAVFFTNYQSRKGQEIAATGRACAVLFWDALQRQVRIEGPVVKSPIDESNEYFASRPWQRRIGAWASQQSQPVPSRAALFDAVSQTSARFGVNELTAESPDSAGANVQVPRPPHWGGYRLWAESIELWVHGEHRIHDRARWTRTLRRADEHSFVPGAWSVTRLQP